MSKAINKMEVSKAAASSCIIIAIVMAANSGIIDCTTSFFDHIVYESRVPMAFIIYHQSFQRERICFSLWECSRAYPQYYYSGTRI